MDFEDVGPYTKPLFYLITSQLAKLLKIEVISLETGQAILQHTSA